MTPLKYALQRLSDQCPNKLEMQMYVDEVRRVSKWALDALDAAEQAIAAAPAQPILERRTPTDWPDGCYVNITDTAAPAQQEPPSTDELGEIRGPFNSAEELIADLNAQQEPPQQSEELPPVGHPLHTLGERLTYWLDDDQWNNAEPLLIEAYSLCSKDSPQQSAEPVAVVPANIGDQSGCIRWLIDEQLPVGTLLYTAPPVQSAEPVAHDLLHWAWTIICNAGGGDWTKESAEWQEAAAKFRERYHAAPPIDPAKLIDEELANLKPGEITFVPTVDPAKRERARKLVELLETISARLEDEGGYVYSQKEGAPHLRIREAAALLKEAYGL